jgi:pimeloyl-ACP methyl ester carboxylesterase
MVPPAAQQMMAERAGATVVEVPASHSVFLSHPDAVAGLIRTALAETAVTHVGI